MHVDSWPLRHESRRFSIRAVSAIWHRDAWRRRRNQSALTRRPLWASLAASVKVYRHIGMRDYGLDGALITVLSRRVSGTEFSMVTYDELHLDKVGFRVTKAAVRRCLSSEAT